MSNEATSLATTLQVFKEDGWDGRRVGAVLEKMREKQWNPTLSSTTAAECSLQAWSEAWFLDSGFSAYCRMGSSAQ